MENMIDLHTHTVMSDGTCTPEEIIERAVKNNVKVVAITDHDTIDALELAAKEAQKYDITFLKGIEFTCPYEEGRLLHILGIGIDTEHKVFKMAYTRMKENKQKALGHILNILEEKGVCISMEELRAHAITQYLDRVDVVRYLLRKGIVKTSVEGWNTYLDPIPYGDEELIGVEEAFDIIKQAGGVSVLAHYTKKIGLYGYTKEQMQQHIQYLKSIGLQAIERYYPSFTEEQVQFADYLISKYELCPSGGTDFHGSHRPGLDVGVGENGFYIPYSVYKGLFNNL